MVSEKSIDEQIKILMSGTLFADEIDSEGEVVLRKQMEAELRERLKSGKSLRVYLGVDPTRPSLHIGHCVPILKLKQFQQLGHNVVFLIGDYTGMIGDPSGQSSERKRFTHEELIKMASDYTNQAFKIIDKDKTEVRYNSEWLSKLKFSDIIEIASIFPLKQIISRRDFQERLARGDSLRYHETLYSLMQGYDAYFLNCDVQVGAYDQHFNMLAGRAIQEYFGQKPHIMITLPLIMGTDGRKMSKSFGNTIDLTDTPEDMYGKTMRISDDLIPSYLDLASGLDINEINGLKERLSQKDTNPMEIKKILAKAITAQYHGIEAAEEAEKHFEKVIQNKEVPDEVEEITVSSEKIGQELVLILFEAGCAKSKGEIRRLIQGRGVKIDGNTIEDIKIPFTGEEKIIQIGKRRFIKVKVSR